MMPLKTLYKKQLIIILFVQSLFLISSLSAENSPTENGTLPVIEIGFNKTTHAYFESAVTYVDIGDVDNVIWAKQETLVKISSSNSSASGETNLTVHTEKGIYGFVIKFVQNPENPYYFFDPTIALKRFKKSSSLEKGKTPVPKPAQEEPHNEVKQEKPTTPKSVAVKSLQRKVLEKRATITFQDPQDINSVCEYIDQSDDFIFDTGIISNKLICYLSGVYMYQEKVILKFTFTNKSAIDFDLTYSDFALKDRKKFKKQISQDLPIIPLQDYTSDNKIIMAHSKNFHKIFIFDKFTPTKNKELIVNFAEENGRTLRFPVYIEAFLDGKTIND